MEPERAYGEHMDVCIYRTLNVDSIVKIRNEQS